MKYLYKAMENLGDTSGNVVLGWHEKVRRPLFRQFSPRFSRCSILSRDSSPRWQGLAASCASCRTGGESENVGVEERASGRETARSPVDLVEHAARHSQRRVVDVVLCAAEGGAPKFAVASAYDRVLFMHVPRLLRPRLLPTSPPFVLPAHEPLHEAKRGHQGSIDGPAALARTLLPPSSSPPPACPS